MKKILCSIGLLLVLLQAHTQQTPIQRQIGATAPERFAKEQPLAAKAVSAERIAAFRSYVRSFALLRGDELVLEKVARADLPALEMELPLEGSVVTLQLLRSRVVDDETQFTVQRGSQQEKVAYQPGAYYYGVIKGQPNTLVALSFFKNNIIGVISNERGKYVLGKSNTLDSRSNEYILYNEKDLLVKDAFTCGTEDGAMNLPIVPKAREYDVAAANVNNCVRVYIETDHQLYINQGSNTTNVLNYVTGLFNVVKTLYQNEAINTTISQVRVWSSVDPYASTSNTDAALTAFGNAVRGGFNGDLAHLFSARNLGGGRAAGFNGLCNPNFSLRTAVSGNLNSSPAFPTYSWNAFVVTHEMGHTLGSRHTHACVWNGSNTAIDGCAAPEGSCPRPSIPSGGGTIMSYCHLTSVGINFNLGFGSQSGDLIRNNVYNAACLTPCCNTSTEIDKVINFPITQSVIHEVSNTLIGSSSVTISRGLESVAFAAGQSIRLLPGFSVRVGSGIFQAYINSCGSALPQTRAPLVQQSTDLSLVAANAPAVEKFTLYPNPSDGVVRIQGPLASVQSVWVTDLLGKEVYKRTKLSGSSLQLGFLPKGMYLINIETDKGKSRHKIVIM